MNTHILKKKDYNWEDDNYTHLKIRSLYGTEYEDDFRNWRVISNGELRLAAIYAPALSASVSSCAKSQALGFLLGFQKFSIHFTIEPDLKWLFFKKKDYFFCGNSISVLPVAIRKYLFRIFFCSLAFLIFFFEGFLWIFSMLIKNGEWSIRTSSELTVILSATSGSFPGSAAALSALSAAAAAASGSCLNSHI